MLLIDWDVADSAKVVQLRPAAATGDTRIAIIFMTNRRFGSAALQPVAAAMAAVPENWFLTKPIKRTELPEAVMEPTGRKLAPSADAANSHTKGNGTVRPLTQRPLRILLADDSHDNRLLIDAYLKKTNHTIDHAEDGALAVAKVKANPYDLVLMDIQMPVMDGYTAVRTIREWERSQGRARVPIIALTASVLDESVLRSLEAGCDAHVAKPVGKAVLFEAIANATSCDSIQAGSLAGTSGGGQMKRRSIQVEAYLRDLVPEFLEHKLADAGALGTAIEQQDYATIGQIGHRIRGEGGSYGFDAVTEMGAIFEQAAQRKDLETARHTLDEFTEYLNSVDVTYG